MSRTAKKVWARGARREDRHAAAAAFAAAASRSASASTSPGVFTRRSTRTPRTASATPCVAASAAHRARPFASESSARTYHPRRAAKTASRPAPHPRSTSTFRNVLSSVRVAREDAREPPRDGVGWLPQPPPLFPGIRAGDDADARALRDAEEQRVRGPDWVRQQVQRNAGSGTNAFSTRHGRDLKSAAKTRSCASNVALSSSPSGCFRSTHRACLAAEARANARRGPRTGCSPRPRTCASRSPSPRAGPAARRPGTHPLP